MEFNDVEMRSVASVGIGNFSKEGVLFIKEKTGKKGKKSTGFAEYWCKLKGNILFYMKGRDRVSEPRGLIILERCSVELDSNETMDYYCFLIVFEGSEPLQLAAATEHERDEWVHSLHTASYECMKMQLQSLREALQGRTGDMLSANNGSSADGSSTPLEDDTDEPWIEICISCDHLPRRASGQSPSPMVEVLCITPPHVSWTKVAQTEVAEETCNPIFLKTVSLSESRAEAKTVIKLALYDVIERLTNTRTFIGQAVFTTRDIAVIGDDYRLRLKVSTPTFVEGGYVTLLAWTDPRCIRDAGEASGIVRSGAATSRSCSVRLERLKKRDQLKPLFANVVCKSFRFPTINDGEELDISEFLGESKLTFVLAIECLKFMRRDSQAWLQQLSLLGVLTGDWERLRLLALEKSSALQAYYSKSADALEEGYLSKGCTFKSSRNKGVKEVEAVPVNLHLHRMLVKNCHTEKGSFYDFITVGAFAAHSFKFKDGGLLRQVTRRCPLCASQNGNEAIQQSKGSSSSSQSAAGHPVHSHRLSSALTCFRVPIAAALVGAQGAATKKTLENCSVLCRAVHSLSDMTVAGHGSSVQASWADVVAQLVTGCSEVLELADQPLVAEGLESLKTKLPESRCDELSSYGLSECADTLAELVSTVRSRCEVLSSVAAGSVGEQLASCIVDIKDDLNAIEALVKRVHRHVTAALTFIMLYDLKDTATFDDEELAMRHDVVVCQAVVAATTGVLSKVRAHATMGELLHRVAVAGMLLEFESLLSCHRDEAGMLEDFAVGVKELSNVRFRFTENPSAVDDYSVYCPQLSGSRYEMVVSLPLPSVVYHSLPWDLQNGRLFGVVPVLFNIGINEIATMAERFGDIRLQEEINKSSFERLREYCEVCMEIPARKGSDTALKEDVPAPEKALFAYSDSIDELLSRLSQQVSSQKNKNVEILHLAAEITRRMGGVRFTSCKSAKDRTAMAITLEEAHILQSDEGMAPHVFTRTLECLRSEGVRRQNTFKNIGSLKYAFNSLQLQSFPKLYRPPNGTYGGGDT